MIITDSKEKEIEIKNLHWPLAADLFMKWGHDINTNSIKVVSIDDITPELNAWGIPWKHTSW